LDAKQKTNPSASDYGSMQEPSSSSELVSTFVLQQKLLWYVHDESIHELTNRMHSSTSSPSRGNGLLPTGYGWVVTEGLLRPNWFGRPAVPHNLFRLETWLPLTS